MNTQWMPVKSTVIVMASILMMTGCSMRAQKPEGASNVRNELTALQSDPQLAGRAPLAIQAAEDAVVAAEKPSRDKEEGAHLVWMAERKLDIARNEAQARKTEEERKALSEQRERSRLDFRTAEADSARLDALSANREASLANSQAASARLDTREAQQESDSLKKQIEAINAKTTERGLVITLGDLLFETGRADLARTATSNLDKLSAFLKNYKERTVLIEGYTDSVGSDSANLGLSQRRADAVKTYLVDRGIGEQRLTASGKGEAGAVASNDSASGRQKNRRVEIIISNTVASQ